MASKTSASKSYAALAGALVLALVAAAFLWQLGEPGAGVSRQVQTAEGSGEADVGGPFSLVNQDGTRVSEQDFRGKHMLVFFGFTYCPDICPTTLSILSAALDEIGPLSEEVVPILITVDPARDTPEMLKPYLSAFGPEFVGLTGTQEEIDAVVGEYRAYYEIVEGDEEDDYTVNHSTIVYLMGPDGEFITNYGLDMGPDAIAADLERRLSGAS